MIIKAQRSLEPHGRALFYSKDRTWSKEGPIPEKWKAVFDEHGDRFFAGVEWKSRKQFPKFKGVLPEQGW